MEGSVLLGHPDVSSQISPGFTGLIISRQRDW